MPYYAKCNGCPYFQQEHLSERQRASRISPPVEFEKNNSKILLVFQAPGDDEWRVGMAILPTVKVGGSAGRRIKMSWVRCKKQRHDFDIINAVQCYPGSDGDRDFKPDAMAINACSNRLETVLNYNSYKKIVVFGDVAKSIMDDICNRTCIYPNIVQAKHPNGGASKKELDSLWNDC
jgi:uracil-DNA glycosylase